MTFQEKIALAFQDKGWDFSSEAYYKLDYTPFMNTIEEVVKDLLKEQKQICADNAEADYTSSGTVTDIEGFTGYTDIEVYVLKGSILNCRDAI